MKKQLLILALLLTATFAWSQGEDIVKVGDAMPAFTIVHDDGTKIESTELKGKVVLINFFATWCPPCQTELAKIKDSFWPTIKDNKDFVMLVIGREHNDAELKTYNEKKGFEFPLYPDKDRKIYGTFAKSLIPRTYLIDKSGKVVKAHVGYKEADFNELVKQINELLK